MSKDTTNTTKAPETTARLLPHVALKLDVFPVDHIKLPVGGYVDLPGKAQASSVTSDKERSEHRPYHLIEYVPALQVFAVHFCRPTLPMRTTYVPAHRVLSWDPA